MFHDSGPNILSVCVMAPANMIPGTNLCFPQGDEPILAIFYLIVSGCTSEEQKRIIFVYTDSTHSETAVSYQRRTFENSQHVLIGPYSLHGSHFGVVVPTVYSQKSTSPHRLNKFVNLYPKIISEQDC